MTSRPGLRNTRPSDSSAAAATASHVEGSGTDDTTGSTPAAAARPVVSATSPFSGSPEQSAPAPARPKAVPSVAFVAAGTPHDEAGHGSADRAETDGHDGAHEDDAEG